VQCSISFFRTKKPQPASQGAAINSLTSREREIWRKGF